MTDDTALLACDDCDRPFTRPSQMGPTPRRCLECRRKAKRASHSTWRRANPDVIRQNKLNAYKRYRRANPLPPEAACETCGTSFERPSKMGAAARWCPPCKADRDRERKRAKDLRHRCAAKGITVGQYRAALAAQDGRCAICRTDQWGPKGPQIDHDHACCPGQKSCGRCFRGLLCVGCNHSLGNLHDDITIILALARYVLNGGAGHLLNGDGHAPRNPRPRLARTGSALTTAG